ncbi:unnamed protein product, partial [Mesorhabditis spiculigera]
MKLPTEAAGDGMQCDADSDPDTTQLPTTYQEHDLPGSSTPDAERAPTDLFAVLSIGDSLPHLDPNNKSYQAMVDGLKVFGQWPEQEQVHFVQLLISKMGHQQLGSIESFLRPMLMRDFITLLPKGTAEQILMQVDERCLVQCELVCRRWRAVIAYGQLWRKLIERKVRSDDMWRGLVEKRGWLQYLLGARIQNEINVCKRLGLPYDQVKNTEEFVYKLHNFYRNLCPRIKSDIERVEENWRNGRHAHQRIECQSENSRGVYCLQYDDEKIVSGLRDNTIKLWNRRDLSLTQVLTGHTGSVLCLQYDSRIIISGSSDSTVRVWDIETGECLNTLIHHGEAVLHLRFGNGTMVTCSKDRSITVWNMVSPQEITVRRVLLGHRAAVNAVDFDNEHIVSGSGDRTIKVWSVDDCQFIRTLSGHRRGIACLQYREGLVVSGSSDFTIRLWEIASGTCLRTLEGHNELVRCIRFDNKRIISGAYDGKIKIWDMNGALDPRSNLSNLCLATLEQHQGRVFRLQFDEFQIVSSSHDDSIVIWDFLNAPVGHPGVQPQPMQQQAAPLPHPHALIPMVAVAQLPAPALAGQLPGAMQQQQDDDDNDADVD